MDELRHTLETYIDKVKAEAFSEGWNACLEKMPKWIPVTERLPVEMQIVLVTVRFPFNGVVKCCTAYQRQVGNYPKWKFPAGCSYEVDVSDCDVIAWMPLPEPYKRDVEK